MPLRIVSLLPSATEIVRLLQEHASKAEVQLIGRR